MYNYLFGFIKQPLFYIITFELNIGIYYISYGL